MVAPRAGALGLSVPVSTGVSAWLQSPGYDLACFVLSPLLGVLWLLTAPSELSNLLMLALLGIPHYLSTFTLYAWEDTRAYYRAHWVAVALGPLGIVLGVALLTVYRIPSILQLTVYFWNVFHVARQSCGILSIYRHRAGMTDPRQKVLANIAIISSNSCMAVWNLAWYPALHTPLTALTPALPQLLWLGSGVIAVLALLWLGGSWCWRCYTGQAPHMPEILFLLTSLTLFHPYLWVSHPGLATTGMLVGHFVQYLGLVWLVHRRKFAHVEPRHTPYWLVYLSAHTAVLLLVFMIIGALYLGLKKLCMIFACALAFDTMLFMLVFTHFYLDRLFWAFKVPQIRQALGPYLLRPAEERRLSTP